jgi:hypothetical protein
VLAPDGRARRPAPARRGAHAGARARAAQITTLLAAADAAAKKPPPTPEEIAALKAAASAQGSVVADIKKAGKEGDEAAKAKSKEARRPRPPLNFIPPQRASVLEAYG